MKATIRKMYVFHYMNSKGFPMSCPACNQKGDPVKSGASPIQERFFIEHVDKGNNGVFGPGFRSYGYNRLTGEGAHCIYCKTVFHVSPTNEQKQKIVDTLRENKRVLLGDIQTIVPPEEIIDRYIEEFIEPADPRFLELKNKVKETVVPIKLERGTHLKYVIYADGSCADLFKQCKDFLGKPRKDRSGYVHLYDKDLLIIRIGSDRYFLVPRSSVTCRDEDWVDVPDLWPKNIIFELHEPFVIER